MVSFYLSPATNDDFDFAYQLKKIAYKEYVEQTWGWNEDFQMNFHKENFSTTNTKIIKVNDESIGTIDVKETNASIFISGLYLLPKYQSGGVGSSIIKGLLKRADAEKKRLELEEVLQVNKKAQRLYQRLGFTMEERDETKFFMYK